MLADFRFDGRETKKKHTVRSRQQHHHHHHLVGGHLFAREVASVADRVDYHAAAGSDRHPGEAAVVQRKPKPSLRWELQRPTDEVANDVAMTHQNLVAVLLLLGIGTVEVLSEGALDACSVLEVFLLVGRKGERKKKIKLVEEKEFRAHYHCKQRERDSSQQCKQPGKVQARVRSSETSTDEDLCTLEQSTTIKGMLCCYHQLLSHHNIIIVSLMITDYKTF